MAYFVVTDLGREVAAEDWREFHKDRLLSVLVQMRDLGVPAPRVEPSMIEGVTGLPRAHADGLAKYLASQGLLKGVGGPSYEVTDAGIQWVRRWRQ
ncbi:MAG TPA: hypothetical protein VH143_16395 [Kofleriaceae bacterium]|nr:hypothetical protein [Kofleriaceae bacterium]